MSPAVNAERWQAPPGYTPPPPPNTTIPPGWRIISDRWSTKTASCLPSNFERTLPLEIRQHFHFKWYGRHHIPHNFPPIITPSSLLADLKQKRGKLRRHVNRSIKTLANDINVFTLPYPKGLSEIKHLEYQLNQIGTLNRKIARLEEERANHKPSRWL